MLRAQATVLGSLGRAAGAQRAAMGGAFRLSARRWATSEIQKKDIEAGDSSDASETGVIEKTDRETLVYFDHILPFRSSNWDIRQWLSYVVVPDKRPELIEEHVEKLANPKSETGEASIPGLKLIEIIPMKRDGGAFVKFFVPGSYAPGTVNAKIQKNVAAQGKKGLVNWISEPAAFPVKGSPWIEDLRRWPTREILIKFEGPALSEEDVYALLRRYGTIWDIKPGDGCARVLFKSFRGSICSKNCISGLKINDTTLHIQYVQKDTKNMLTDWIVNHTRISVPLIFALLAGLAVLIFEPIREFFIENKITHQFTFDRNNKYLKWIYLLANSTVSSFQKYIFNKDDAGNVKRALWSERMDVVKELKLWIEENVNTFIIVRGPRGTGKHELVMQHALHDRRNILYIDCDKLVKSRSDAQFIANAAHEVGYFPVFPWLNSFAGVFDLAIQSLTGQKSGLSETKDVQFRNILSTALMAIRNISLHGYKPIVHSGDDEISVKEEDYLQQHPEKKPVIVIDRFTSVNRAETNAFTYKELADWASLLVSMNVAHVIFLTEDVGSQQFLAQSLPDQVFKNIILSDASKETAKQYVLEHIDEDIDEEKLDEVQKQKLSELSRDLDVALDPIGGRMLDLQAFSRRVKTGESPSEALERMINQTAEQITQIFLNKDQNVKSAQAWILIKELAEKQSIEYKELIYHPLFKAAPEAALVELERNGLISVIRDRGILRTIYPAKPLYRTAFKNLVNDPQTFKVLETAYLFRLISFETGRIQKFEEELKGFNYYSDPKLFKSRLDYLANKIKVSSEVVIKAESDIKKFASSN